MTPIVLTPEFRAAAERAANRLVFVALASAAAVVVVVVGLFSLVPSGGRWDDEWFLWAAVVLAVWATAAVVVVSLLMWRRAALDPLTRCPHCRRSITGQVPLVVASRRCYHCGGVLLVDPDEPPDPDADPPGLPTRWEYLEADRRHQLISAPVLLAAAIGSYIGCGGAGALTSRWESPWNTIGFALIAVVVPVSATAVLICLYKWARRNPALTCHWCGMILAGQRAVVGATRRCVKCGRTAIAPRHRPYPPHAGPPLTIRLIDERVALQRAAGWRAFWRAGLMLVALGVVMALPYRLYGIDGLEQRLAPFVGPRWSILLATSGLFLMAAVGLIGIAIASGISLNAVKRRHPLDCPRCGKTFLPATARATRCCSSCHWPIVADDPVT